MPGCIYNCDKYKKKTRKDNESEAKFIQSMNVEE